jgi:hypothetical protein
MEFYKARMITMAGANLKEANTAMLQYEKTGAVKLLREAADCYRKAAELMARSGKFNNAIGYDRSADYCENRYNAAHAAERASKPSDPVTGAVMEALQTVAD